MKYSITLTSYRYTVWTHGSCQAVSPMAW